MIDSFWIKNFETHLDTVVDLHPGVNTFVGESDEGKSGLVRALTLNAKNRPRGDEYRNDQLDPKKDKKKAVQVSVSYKKSGTVLRERDNASVNHYVIDGKEPLRALRSDVPDEVKDVTRMRDVNIQSQHPSEQYFLLADNPGTVAKQFNKVAGLTIMDDAIKSINSQVRSCNAEIAVSKKAIEKIETELKETEWVSKAEKFSKKLENYQVNVRKTAGKYFEINDTVKVIDEVSEKLQQLDGIEAAKIALKSLEDQKVEISDTKNRRTSISNLILDVENVDTRLNDITDTDKALNAIESLEKLEADAWVESQKMLEINLIVNEFVTCTNKLDYAEKEYLVNLKKYETMRENTECPTCGRTGK